MESFYSHLTKQALMQSNELEVEDRKPNILKQRVDLPCLVSNLENERACVCQWTHAHCPCRLASGMAFSPSDSVAIAARPSLPAKVSKGASSATEEQTGAENPGSWNYCLRMVPGLSTKPCAHSGGVGKEAPLPVLIFCILGRAHYVTT